MPAEILPRHIPVIAQAFIEPFEQPSGHFRRQHVTGPFKQGRGQRGVVENDAVVVADLLSPSGSGSEIDFGRHVADVITHGNIALAFVRAEEVFDSEDAGREPVDTHAWVHWVLANQKGRRPMKYIINQLVDIFN